MGQCDRSSRRQVWKQQHAWQFLRIPCPIAKHPRRRHWYAYVAHHLTLRRSADLYLHSSDITVDALGRPVAHIETNPGLDKLTASEASRYILQHVPETWQKMMQTNYSYGIERDPAKLEANDLDHTKWTNPLEIRCAGTCVVQPFLNCSVTTDCLMPRA